MSRTESYPERLRFFALLVLGLLLYAPTVRHKNLGDCGGSSRLATAESVVERGRFTIDGSSLAYTCDVMAIGGKLYSDKPPLLSLYAALLYAPLHHGLGLGFNPRSIPGGPDPSHDHTYALLTFLVIVVFQALLVAVVDRAGLEAGLSPLPRGLTTFAVAFGTLLWPLAGLFNSHTPAALLLFLGVRAAFIQVRPLTAGIWLGLLAAVDIPLGGLALVVVLPVIAQSRHRFVMGSLLPLLLHGFFNWWIVGDLLPFQLHRELYDQTTGHTGADASGFAENAGLGFYAMRNLLGALGVFSLTPLLALALPLAGATALAGGRRARLAGVSVFLFVATAALYVFAWPEAVGCSYGMRHLAPLVPPLLLTAGCALAGRKRLVAFTLLTVLSSVLAAGGVLLPTTCAGFVHDRSGLVPGWVFWTNLRDELLPRVSR